LDFYRAIDFSAVLNRAFGRLKSTSLMGTITKRTLRGCTAAAESKRFFAIEIERISGGIGDGHRSGDKKRAIILNEHFNF
jgi:hypothetical protein